MKEIYFILFILSLLSNLSESIEESSENNRVSKLIGMVRMETIDKSLLFLPKRNEVNILQMVNYMIKAKEEYSFNEAESAFLVFKWIGQNIRINFNDEDLVQVKALQKHYLLYSIIFALFLKLILVLFRVT